MDQIGGGTSYVAAYEAAKVILSSKGREYFRRIVMITDGKSDEPVEIAKGWVKSFTNKVLIRWFFILFFLFTFY